jgi:hypothetical protein
VNIKVKASNSFPTMGGQPLRTFLLLNDMRPSMVDTYGPISDYKSSHSKSTKDGVDIEKNIDTDFICQQPA